MAGALYLVFQIAQWDIVFLHCVFIVELFFSRRLRSFRPHSDSAMIRPFYLVRSLLLQFTKVSTHARSIFQLTSFSFACMLVCLVAILVARLGGMKLRLSVSVPSQLAFLMLCRFLAGRQLYRSYFLVSLARFCLALGLVSVVMYVAPNDCIYFRAGSSRLSLAICVFDMAIVGSRNC